MKRGILLIGLALVVFSPFRLAHAQQAGKIPRIGFLFSLSSAVNTDRIEAFRQGLRELGYVEGKNIVIEYRYAEGKRDRLSELAAELARLKVEVIVSGGEKTLSLSGDTERGNPITSPRSRLN
jgi:putative ABC transport system substrate-binding protein